MEWDTMGQRRCSRTFTATGIPYFWAGAFGKQIGIQDKDGQVTAIEHSLAYHAYKTLGTYQAATKRQKVQFQMLQKKATGLMRNLALSTCSENAAWLYYSSVFMKGVGYPLSVSQLTKTQLKQIQAPMLALALNRLGYPKSLSRTVVFGSRLYGGLEFDSLATAQGASKVMLLVRHLRTQGQPYMLSLIVLDRFQYNAGVGYHILEDTQSVLPHLEGVWIPTVREYLAEINRSLQIAKAVIHWRIFFWFLGGILKKTKTKKDLGCSAKKRGTTKKRAGWLESDGIRDSRLLLLLLLLLL
jgi:hypothetical protein